MADTKNHGRGQSAIAYWLIQAWQRGKTYLCLLFTLMPIISAPNPVQSTADRAASFVPRESECGARTNQHAPGEPVPQASARCQQSTGATGNQRPSAIDQ